MTHLAVDSERAPPNVRGEIEVKGQLVCFGPGPPPDLVDSRRF